MIAKPNTITTSRSRSRSPRNITIEKPKIERWIGSSDGWVSNNQPNLDLLFPMFLKPVSVWNRKQRPVIL
uniref:Uncharacterized protein n=1 Tax=Picea glauca TaxID=3330 RepID=A0A117NHJ2_PICGL|nr:hypothetical protein ABT39_MTgene4483 [Picea glauca]